MKRSSFAVITLIVLLAGLRAASAPAIASDDQDNHRSSEVIHLVERTHDLTFQDTGAPGPSLGDRLIFSSDLFDGDGQKVGRDGADCVIVRLDTSQPPPLQQVVQCTITVQLHRRADHFSGVSAGHRELLRGHGRDGRIPNGAWGSFGEGYSSAPGGGHYHQAFPLRV